MGDLHCRRRVLSVLVLCAFLVVNLACVPAGPPAVPDSAQHMPCCPASQNSHPTCCVVDRSSAMTLSPVRETVQLQPASVPDRALGLRPHSPIPAGALALSLHVPVFQLKADLRV